MKLMDITTITLGSEAIELGVSRTSLVRFRRQPGWPSKGDLEEKRRWIAIRRIGVAIWAR